MSLWDGIKGLFGGPTGAGAKSLTPKHSPSTAVVLFGMVVVGVLLGIAALGKDSSNPFLYVIAAMVFVLAIFIPVGTWIFSSHNHQERLTGKPLSDFLRATQAAGLGVKDTGLIEHSQNQIPMRGQDVVGPKGIGLVETDDAEEGGDK